MDSVLEETIVASLRLIKRDGFLERIVRLFDENTRALLGEIQLAYKTRDPIRLETSAHSLKSAAGSVGAHRVSALAQALEELGQSGSVDLPEADLLKLEDEIRQALEALGATFLTGQHRHRRGE